MDKKAKIVAGHKGMVGSAIPRALIKRVWKYPKNARMRSLT